MDLISDSHVPKYAQIADIFRQRIARGIWAQGLKPIDHKEMHVASSFFHHGLLDFNPRRRNRFLRNARIAFRILQTA